MIDEEDARITPADHASPDRYGETLLYDFAKFMTTLSLLVLGGMLTLSQAARAGEVPIFSIVFVTGTVALAGMLAFSTASNLASARATRREPSPRLPLMMRASTGLVGIGTGGFIVMWLDTLS
jgi:hypothetical protein